MSRQLLVWDYEYEWTNGIFLRADELVEGRGHRAWHEGRRDGNDTKMGGKKFKLDKLNFFLLILIFYAQ